MIVPYVPLIQSTEEKKLNELENKRASIIEDKSLNKCQKLDLYNQTNIEYKDYLNKFDLNKEKPQADFIDILTSKIVDQMYQKLKPELNLIKSEPKDYTNEYEDNNMTNFLTPVRISKTALRKKPELKAKFDDSINLNDQTLSDYNPNMNNKIKSLNFGQKQNPTFESQNIEKEIIGNKNQEIKQDEINQDSEEEEEEEEEKKEEKKEEEEVGGEKEEEKKRGTTNGEFILDNKSYVLFDETQYVKFKYGL
jgi:hypothetical protein